MLSCVQRKIQFAWTSTNIGRTLPAAAVEARVSACSVVKFILLHLPIQIYGHVSSSSSAICWLFLEPVHRRMDNVLVCCLIDWYLEGYGFTASLSDKKTDMWHKNNEKSWCMVHASDNVREGTDSKARKTQNLILLTPGYFFEALHLCRDPKEKLWHCT